MDAYHRQMLDLVRAALDEDIGVGDVTSLACLEPHRVRAEIVAKSEGVLSGVELVYATFCLIDSANEVKIHKKDGECFAPGDRIITVAGFNQTILTAERTALNFLGHLSGIATLTAAFADKLRGTACRILDTRKTTPGYRLLEKKAVVHGGGTNHRIGLYDMVLIKDNHIAAAGSITDAVRLTREFLATVESRQQFGKGPYDFEVEIEVTDESQVNEAIDAEVNRLLLDNQSTDSLARLVKLARERNPDIKLEASGNITLDNVAEIAATGVDFVSAGALTHSAPGSDFSMKVIGDA